MPFGFADTRVASSAKARPALHRANLNNADLREAPPEPLGMGYVADELKKRQARERINR